MAGVMNPFELLHGASEQLASTKKNKKSKKNAKAHANGSVAQTAAGSNGLAASSAPLNALESCSQLEKAAKTHTRGPERLKLWDSWVSQVWQCGGAQSCKLCSAALKLELCPDTVMRANAGRQRKLSHVQTGKYTICVALTT